MTETAPTGPRYETAYELQQRTGHTDTVVCTDCGAFVMDVAAHDRFHSSLSGGVREQIAAHVEAIAANYPEDVFPPGSDSRDAISGTAMRHAYRNAARSIREDSEVSR